MSNNNDQYFILKQGNGAPLGINLEGLEQHFRLSYFKGKTSNPQESKDLVQDVIRILQEKNQDSNISLDKETFYFNNKEGTEGITPQDVYSAMNLATENLRQEKLQAQEVAEAKGNTENRSAPAKDKVESNSAKATKESVALDKIFNTESKVIGVGQHGPKEITGLNLNKLENYIKSQGIKDPESISEIKKDLIDKLQENNDTKQSGNKVTVDGKGNIKFNNKDGENNNISPEDVKGFINEKVETLNKAKEAIENNSEIKTDKAGNPKVTFNLKNLKEDLTNLGKEKLQQAGDKLKEFGDKAKQFISDMSDKIKGFIGGLIEGLFGKDGEKTAESNKAEDKKDKESLDIKNDGDTATIEAKKGFSPKEFAVGLAKFAVKLVVEIARGVGKIAGMIPFNLSN